MDERRLRLLLILQRPPYGGPATREALDAALAAAAFNINVQLLFTGDGVWQLQPGQQPDSIAAKSIEKMLGALSYYDIQAVFVDAVALASRGLSAEALAIPAVPVDAETLRQLVREADQVIAL